MRLSLILKKGKDMINLVLKKIDQDLNINTIITIMDKIKSFMNSMTFSRHFLEEFLEITDKGQDISERTCINIKLSI